MSNRLAEEASPYLLQHAENPVDWYPWGAEALAAATERDVPILLSIGYSSCHWCHVMAHESFEDAATAAYMNENFVNIKVDREERPDIDAIYMEAAQAMSGHGGWPLTAFLAPDQTPFFAGTYFPPDPRPNMPSFMQLMESIVEVWKTQRQAIVERGDALSQQLSATARLEIPDDPISADTLETAVAALHEAYDRALGGFGGAPKFPPHSVLEFLLGRSDAADRELALETLRKIAAGGIHDQLAGGFSRYSVDDRWHIPHFEKMLYDNALLARRYLQAWQVTGEPEFASVARSTLEWMLAEMSGPEGGFASALDADSADQDGEPVEGAFYAWEIDELREIIESVEPGQSEAVLRYWGVIDHGEFEGKNVLFVAAPELRPDDAVLQAVVGAALARRNERPRPQRDEKRITAWNAMAIAAFADAGAALGDQRFLSTAVRCAEFIESELALPDGRLRRSWTEGRPGPAGYLEDHAHCAAAYLTLYECTGEERWFVRARQLADLTIEHFHDVEYGGFFSVADDHERLIARRKDIEDNPTPSGNATIALTLLRLAAFTGDLGYRAGASDCLLAVQRLAARLPLGFGQSLSGIAFHLGPVKEVALVGPQATRQAFEDAMHSAYLPNTVLAASEFPDGSAVPLLEGRSVEGTAAAFVCENFTCDLPLLDASELLTRVSS